MEMMMGWLIVVCMTGALGVFPGPNQPDITMLYKEDTQICVAGSNTNGYGLALMSETIQDNVYINKFEYKDENGTEIDSSSDCTFEDTNGGECLQNWRSNYLTWQRSGTVPIFPVTDERWNNFEIYHTDEQDAPPTYDRSYDIAQQNFFTSISIRSSQNAQILLCSDASKQPQNDACYRIIIDGFIYFKFTTIRKCITGVPDLWTTESECKIFRANITAPENLLDESHWTHFMLSREDGNRIRLWLWDLDTGARPLLDYTDDDPLPLTTMYVRSFKTIADWKVHEYKYASIIYRDGIIRLGPTITFAKSSSICVSLYVTLCSKCKMDIRLETEGGIIQMQTSIEGDSNAPFMTWRNVRLQGGVSASADHFYQLYATLSTTDGSDTNTFWAIDDFRKCSKNEIRVASTASNKKLLCQSLKQPGWTFNPDQLVNNKNEPPICPDGRYIGQHCNISCSSISKKNGCGGQKICMSIRQGNDKGACTCAAGYVWESSGCTQSCDRGYYGYNCKQKCGHCIFTPCHINTGQCLLGCKGVYLAPYCQTTYPHLASPPVVDKIIFTNITMKFNNLNIIGNVANVHLIQLECKNANRQWTDCGKPISLSPGQKISITGLEKETTYFIRAIVYTKTGQAYKDDGVPIIEATTTCKVDREIYVTVTSRSATTSFQTEKDDCSMKNYRIELQQNGIQIKSQQGVWQDMVLPHLTPYTNYNVIVTNVQFPSYIQNSSFQTKQDTPSEIKDLSISETTDTTIVLSWKEPSEKNGVIQKYTIKYELTQRIECEDSSFVQNNTVTIYPPMISDVTLSDLQPYSTYNISVIAETILPGPPIGLRGNTTMINNISEEELPDTISIYNVSAQSVTILWPVNCVKQQGPLYFQLVLKCVQDAWCDQIQDIVSDDMYRINEYTTHDLTPFTHYSVELRAKRSKFGDLTTINRTTKLYSLAGKPPAVRRASVYSKNRTSISLRWLDPYPPHGLLEKFAIKYCYNISLDCKTIEITTNQLTPCDLWSENFNCYKIRNLITNFQYIITITAKNKVSKLWSSETLLTTVYTAEEKSSAPLNLAREWEYNKIKLSWNHPDITRGELKKFIITLNQTGTEFENQDTKSFYSYEYLVSKEMKTYNYTINKTYQYSSLYIITVCGVNSLYGENATLHIFVDTPPETPDLNGDFTVDENSVTASTVTVIIPSVQTETYCYRLYVIVSEMNSTPKTNSSEENKLKREILNYSKYEHKWIAKEITELNGNKFKFVLGNDESTKSKHLNETVFNHKLQPSTDYEITLVLINMCKNKNSNYVYQLNVRTAWEFRPELFSLFLLLLVPGAIFFCYRTKTRVSNSRSVVKEPIESDYGYLEPKPHVRNTYLEIVDSEPVYSTPDVNIQHKTLAEGHIYETVIYSTKKQAEYMNLLSKDEPVEKE